MSFQHLAEPYPCFLAALDTASLTSLTSNLLAYTLALTLEAGVTNCAITCELYSNLIGGAADIHRKSGRKGLGTRLTAYFFLAILQWSQ